MFGSRNKGNKAELYIAGRLQEWWRKSEPGCLFCRVPLSGGWRQPEHRTAFNLAGDLMTDAKLFPWAVEVKHREGWTEERLEQGKASPVWGWWRQAQEAADELKKKPILFFRKNLFKKKVQPWRVMFPDEQWQDVPELRLLMSWTRREIARPEVVGNVWPCVANLDDFLAVTSTLFEPRHPLRRKKKVISL